MLKRIRAGTRENTVVMTVALPPELHRQMAAVKAATGLTMNELLRRAMAEWLARRARRGK